MLVGNANRQSITSANNQFLRDHYTPASLPAHAALVGALLAISGALLVSGVYNWQYTLYDWASLSGGLMAID